jgi:hypothetical protein
MVSTALPRITRRTMKTLLLLSVFLGFARVLSPVASAQSQETAPRAVPVAEEEAAVEGGEDVPLPVPEAPIAVKRAQLIDTEFNAKSVRPEKITYFRTKAAELNRRHESLSVEREEALASARKRMAAFYSEVMKAGGGPPGDDLTPWVSPYFRERDRLFRKDLADFEKEVNAEIRIKRTRDAEMARAKAAAAEAAAKLKDQPPLNAPPPSAEPRPVTEPVPSSVPGLPPGVEPAKKQKSALPPGVTRGK